MPLDQQRKLLNLVLDLRPWLEIVPRPETLGIPGDEDRMIRDGDICNKLVIVTGIAEGGSRCRCDSPDR